ncbi:MAG: hypothetical protein HY234_03955 [Acidobacteria bacterium]|nr:hypothetical protein [Acidobacteriota bacterium]
MGQNVNPNLEWYTAISKLKALLPRCPFASVNRCPRFYESLSQMGEAGSTKIESVQDQELLKRWKSSDLWPVTLEEATGIMSRDGQARHFRNFCPEVLFDRFGLFATSLSDYSDETDREVAHRGLARQQAAAEDWRWAWVNLKPMHYSECPRYSPLAQECTNPNNRVRNQGEPTDEIVTLRPTFYGMGLDLKALLRRLKRWWQCQRKKN